MRGKTWCKTICRVVLSLFFALVLVFSAAPSVFAAESDTEDEAEVLDGKAEQGGVSVKTTTDKDSYRSGQTAQITVSVTNTNDYDMTGVTVEYKLPINFELKEGDKKQTIDSLAAGETKEFQVSAVVTEDKNAEIVETGLSTGGIIAIVAGIVVAAAIIVVVIILVTKKGKKAPKTGVSVLLITAILTGSLAIAPDEAIAFTEDGLAENTDFGRVSVHDPSIVKDPETGTYYIFGSHLAFAKSTDLLSWSSLRININTDYQNLFAQPWSWCVEGGTKDGLSGRMWAPDVIWNETMQKWCMYMSIDGDNWCSSICLLTADELEGPYEYQGVVVYSGINNKNVDVDETKTDVYQVLGEDADLSRYQSTGFSCINAIDPCVRYDDNGDLYMVYGSWSAGIFMLKLDKETGLRDYDVTYETERDVSDAYFGTKIAGGYYNSGEGPYILHTNGYYYLFVSYAALEATGGYQMRVYRSENIDGPYVDQNGVSAICTKEADMKKTNYGVKLFGSYDMSGITQVQVAQGHNSAFVDDDGKIYVVYHTRFQSELGNNEGHQVRVHQLFVNEDGWLVAAPYEYSGETLSEDGYTAEEVSGTYDFIYHEPTQYYTVAAGLQMGIVGSEETTTQELTVQKETVVAKRKAVIKAVVTYSHEGSAKVVVNEDGTVSGDYAGTWKFTEGANVEMVLNGVTYKGVFLEQQDESIDREMRMTFTLLGDNVTVWGVNTNFTEGKE